MATPLKTTKADNWPAAVSSCAWAIANYTSALASAKAAAKAMNSLLYLSNDQQALLDVLEDIFIHHVRQVPITDSDFCSDQTVNQTLNLQMLVQH